MSNPRAGVMGVKVVQRAFKTRKRMHAKGLHVGLMRAGLFLQRESQKLVPIDKSILKNSANTRAEGLGFNTAVIVSYGTDYALYVHENLEAQHAPGSVAKFLEIPLRLYQGRMGAIIIDAVEKAR